MAKSHKSQSSKPDTSGENHLDKMRLTLLVETATDLGLSSQLVLDRLADAAPSTFKILLDEGLAAKSNPFYSRVMSTMLDVNQAICLGALYAKFPTSGTKDVTRIAALTTYVTSESKVMEFDKTIPELKKTPIFRKVRRELRKHLDGFSLEDVISSLHFGPGVTSTPAIKLLSHKLAYIQRNEGALSLPEMLYDLLYENGLISKTAISLSSIVSDLVHLGQTTYLPPRCTKNLDPFIEVITTVPKDALTDRTISTLPLMITLFGVSANEVLSRVIHQNESRVEFIYQHRCSDFLKESFDQGYETTATLDLKDASGHVSWALLEELIDNQDVLEFIKAVRAPVSMIELKLKGKKKVEKVLSNDSVLDYSSWSSRFIGDLPEAPTLLYTWDDVLSQYPFVKSLDNVDFEIIQEPRPLVRLYLTKYSHAGMGSGTTFPIMAALISSIIRATFRGNYRVFGDDIVLTDTSENDVQSLMKHLQLFGFVVNSTKSCYGSKPMRECVGSWFYKDLDSYVQFTPLYIRENLSDLVDPPRKSIPSKKEKGTFVSVPGRCDNKRVLHYAVKLANYARSLNHSVAPHLVAWVLQNSEIPIAFVPMGSGLFGLEVESSRLWSYFVPYWGKDALKPRLEGVRCIIPLLHKTATAVIPIRVDHELQKYYLKLNAIQLDVFNDDSPASFVDLDVVRLKRKFTPDSFIGPLALNQCTPQLLIRQFILSDLDINGCLDKAVSDRPEDNKATYFQSSQRLEIPPQIILGWENERSPL